MKSNSKWLGIAICCIFTALLPPSARADDDCQITFFFAKRQLWLA